MPVTVLVSDDNEGLRKRVRRVIEGVVAVVGEAATDEETLRMARELRPDVILVDVDLPPAGGVETTQRIKAQQEAKVILMTSRDEEAYLSATGKSGADAFLPKKSIRAEALSVLRAVAGPLLRGWSGRERRRAVGGGFYTWDGKDRRRGVGRERRGRAVALPSPWDGDERRRWVGPNRRRGRQAGP